MCGRNFNTCCATKSFRRSLSLKLSCQRERAREREKDRLATSVVRIHCAVIIAVPRLCVEFRRRIRSLVIYYPLSIAANAINTLFPARDSRFAKPRAPSFLASCRNRDKGSATRNIFVTAIANIRLNIRPLWNLLSRYLKTIDRVRTSHGNLLVFPSFLPPGRQKIQLHGLSFLPVYLVFRPLSLSHIASEIDAHDIRRFRVDLLRSLAIVSIYDLRSTDRAVWARLVLERRIILRYEGVKATR